MGCNDSAPDDYRFTEPLYTIPRVARYIGMVPSTLRSWVRGYTQHFPDRPPVHGDPILKEFRGSERGPTLPYISFAEAFILASFREAGVSLQHIRRALRRLEDELDLEHVLASRMLYHDGRRIFYGTLEESEDSQERRAAEKLFEVVSGNYVFVPVVRRYLERVSWDEQSRPKRLILPITERPILAAHPYTAAGKPVFRASGAPLEDIIARWKAGDSFEFLSKDYEVPVEDLREALLTTQLARA
ncbi:MAG: DUF433 domain-containing protein [Egibacteraceae bacterium]